MKPFIYLDMDGVLADFERQSYVLFGDSWKEEIDKPRWGRFSEFPDLYNLLPVMPDALELYEGCCDILGDRNRVQILTALPNRAKEEFPEAARHKIEWAHRSIHPAIRVHFGPFAQDKQYHVKHAHDVLIDDMSLNIEQWKAAGGIGILHTSAHNSLKELELWREQLNK